MPEYTTLEIVSTIIANGEARGLDFSGRDLAGIDLSRDGWEEEFAEESERLRADFEACLRRQGDGQPPHHAAGSVRGG